jgi:hypothetical protein
MLRKWLRNAKRNAKAKKKLEKIEASYKKQENKIQMHIEFEVGNLCVFEYSRL